MKVASSDVRATLDCEPSRVNVTVDCARLRGRIDAGSKRLHSLPIMSGSSEPSSRERDADEDLIIPNGRLQCSACSVNQTADIAT
jgi:hypothetical protein